MQDGAGPPCTWQLLPGRDASSSREHTPCGTVLLLRQSLLRPSGLQPLALSPPPSEPGGNSTWFPLTLRIHHLMSLKPLLSVFSLSLLWEVWPLLFPLEFDLSYWHLWLQGPEQTGPANTEMNSLCSRNTLKT